MTIVWRSLFREPQWITAYKYRQIPSESLGYIFAAESICLLPSSASFQTVLLESHNTETHDIPIPRQTLTDNGHSRSFKILFRCGWKAIKGLYIYIWLCMWKFGRYSEQKKRTSPFSTTPLSYDAPSPANSREYRHLTLLQTRIHGLQFCNF